MLAVAEWTGRVLLVDAVTGTERWDRTSYREQDSNVCRVAMSPDGRFVASVSDTEEICGKRE